MQIRSEASSPFDPATGEVLAMVSTPTYDPNVLLSTATGAKVPQRIAAKPEQPFIRPFHHTSMPSGLAL